MLKIRALCLVALMGALLSLSACGHHRTKFEGTEGQASSGEPGKEIAGKVEWVKNKGDMLDIRLALTNNSEHGIEFKKDAIKATYAGVEGHCKENKFHDGIGAHMSDSRMVMFQFDKAPKSGTLVFTIDPIMDQVTGKKVAALKFELPVTK